MVASRERRGLGADGLESKNCLVNLRFLGKNPPMASTARLFAAAFVALTLTAPAPALAQFVGVVGDSGQYGFFNLASPTNSYTQISSNAFQNIAITGLTSSGSGSAGYGIARFAGSAALLTVNLATGANATVGTINAGSGQADYVGIAFNLGNATLYTTYYGDDTLRTLNPSTAAATVVGGTGASEYFPDVGRMAFAGGSLYATLDTLGTGSGNGLYRLNTSTGAATFLGNGGGSASIYANLLSFGNGVNLYGIDSSNRTLYQINLTNGNLTSLGTIGGPNVPASFEAAVVIPEPGTAVLVTVAGLAAVAARRAKARRARRGA